MTTRSPVPPDPLAASPALRAGDVPHAAEGTSLKKRLLRAERARKMRALALVVPLLIFVLVTFIAPIADMLFRSVENHIVSETLPRTVLALEDWDYGSSNVPGEDVFAAFYVDLFEARAFKVHTRLASRLNYESNGMASLFRKTGRKIGGMDTERYAQTFRESDAAWADPDAWMALMADPSVAAVLPETSSAWSSWRRVVNHRGDSLAKEDPGDVLFVTLLRDLQANGERIASATGPHAAMLQAALEAAAGMEPLSLRDRFVAIEGRWGDAEVWGTIAAFSDAYTAGYFLAAVDLQHTPAGVRSQPESQQIYVFLFERTLFLSLVITLACICLGYPVAFLLASLPLRVSNLLLILVLLPFWTSLLVRTSAWKVLLQQQGVINDLLVWAGLVADSSRWEMINNQTGTIIAMTHILLPFMILPLYSVMKTIPGTYARAARSLGANEWTVFRRVYFPQTVPGIGAGCILVFILAIGYYITPELVGGTTGTFISNRIAYHISSSLNWGLAAALGTILLIVVIVLYWIYDKIVGIDSVRVG